MWQNAIAKANKKRKVPIKNTFEIKNQILVQFEYIQKLKPH